MMHPSLLYNKGGIKKVYMIHTKKKKSYEWTCFGDFFFHQGFLVVDGSFGAREISLEIENFSRN